MRAFSSRGGEVRREVSAGDDPFDAVPRELADRGVRDRGHLSDAEPRQAQHVQQRRSNDAPVRHDRDRLVGVIRSQSFEGRDDASGKPAERLAAPARKIFALRDAAPFVGELLADLFTTRASPSADVDLAPSRVDTRLEPERPGDDFGRLRRTLQIARIEDPYRPPAVSVSRPTQMGSEQPRLLEPYVAERYVGVTLPALLAIPRRFSVADEKYPGHGVANFIPSIARRFEGPQCSTPQQAHC